MIGSRFEFTVAKVGEELALAKADFEAMLATAEAHPCQSCDNTLRNKRVRYETLQDVAEITKAAFARFNS